jgi:hypothetical protein
MVEMVEMRGLEPLTETTRSHSRFFNVQAPHFEHAYQAALGIRLTLPHPRDKGRPNT